MGKWGSIAKDQGVDGKSPRGNIRGTEAFWLNQLDNIFAEGRALGMKEFVQIWRVRFLVNDMAAFLLKLGDGKMDTEF